MNVPLDVSSKIELGNYLHQDLVGFLKVNGRDEALNALTELAYKVRKIPDQKLFLEAILQREKIVSTGIGMGVAIPHAKLPNLSGFFIVVGIIKSEGIDWEAIDQLRVKIIFMIGGPDNKQTEYLRILSLLTLIIRNEQMRKKLLSLTSAEDVVTLLKNS